MPGRPFQSCLEPHLETIHALRLRKQTWREVAEVLKQKHGLSIDPSAICKFFKRQVRPNIRHPLGYPPLKAVPSLVANARNLLAESSNADHVAAGMGAAERKDFAEDKFRPEPSSTGVPLPPLPVFIPANARPKRLTAADFAAMQELPEP